MNRNSAVGMSLEELERELLASRIMLENNLQGSAPIFANPFGETAPAVVDLLGRTGYQAACSSVVGLNRPGGNLYHRGTFHHCAHSLAYQYGYWHHYAHHYL